MKCIISISLFLFAITVQSEAVIDYSVTSSYWNVETNTLDIIVQADPFTIEELYANHDKIKFALSNRERSEFELNGISIGLGNMSEKKSSIPNKILVILDHGEDINRDQLLIQYRQLAAEILSKHPDGYVFDIAILSNRLSNIQRVSKYTLANSIQELTSSMNQIGYSDFNRLFKSIDIQMYKKLYILTNGLSPTLVNDMQSYDGILDREKLGNTQVLPVSKETVVNDDFFSYLEGLNYMSISRPSYAYIPEGEMPKPLSPHDRELLLLKYQQTIESPLTNKPFRISVSYDGNDAELEKSFVGVLRPFTSGIINTSVGTKKSSIKENLLYGILLSCFLYFLIPFYNRITFKRSHVYQYSDIKQEGITHSDPLKMSKIKDQDQVVSYGEHVMLLESWKYIKENMANPKYAKEYNHFYVDTVDGNLFNQQSSPFKYVLAIWLGSVLATVAGLGYIILSQNVIENWQALEIYFTVQNQVTGTLPILSNALIILFILLGSQLILETIKWSQNKTINTKRVIIKCVEVTLISCLIMGATYAFHQSYLNRLPISVFLLLNISIYVTVSYFGSLKNIKLYILQQFLLICILAYVAYQILTTYILSAYFSDNLVFQISSFIFFSGLGCLLIRYQKTEQKSLGLKIVSPPEIERDIFSLEQHFQNELTNEFSIGKNPDADLYVKWLDIDVENNHAIITKTEGQFEIEPTEGKIYINRNQIFDKTAITGNDEIKFGEHSISHFTVINL